jgi:23S rRNA (cytidine1920-2'-O)/16S rRNA (cytidine1409-2'-O)-methyltransferase
MKRKTSSTRLDRVLVERGLADSPQKALAMILAGEVRVNGERSGRAGTPVAQDARIEIASRAPKYVSRGGVKLEGALEDFGVDPVGRLCLDIGSSNGGFTDCLLQHGAERVYAVDVNVDQLDWKLQQDPRVIRIERNAREIRKEDIPELVSIIVIDVSFISVRKVIAPVTALAGPGCDFIILVKPQFELPREEIAAGGVVTDKRLHEKAILRVRAEVESIGLECIAVRPSRLTGAEGNQEYFLHARKKTME